LSEAIPVENERAQDNFHDGVICSLVPLAFLHHYTQTVTRKKVAGIEVASFRGLVF
jgi:hypothetical protein